MLAALLQGEVDVGERLETKIFVSYSRADAEPVGRITKALREQAGFTVFKDTEDILPTEEWRKRLESLILAADTIVFCLSPNSAASKVCAWEVETAERYNKRIVPFVIEATDVAAVPVGLSKLNFIFADEDERYDQALRTLIQSIEVDIGWLRDHTRIGELTQRWVARGKSKAALLRGDELGDAEQWARYQPSNAPVLTEHMSQFLSDSRRESNLSARRTRLAIVALASIAALGALSFQFKEQIQSQIYRWTKVRPHLLTTAAESTLKPGDEFSECQDCPEMVVLPAGNFLMGSSAGEVGRQDIEGPQRQVTINYEFAVSRTEVTFDQWDACVADGGCANPAGDAGWGRGSRPAVNISWDDANEFVLWLSNITGKPYRLLTESEWEYAARAGSATAWSFGNNDGEIGDHAWHLANSDFKSQTVGQKKPNPFGLYDMHGNTEEWVQDCWVSDYSQAPADGSAATAEKHVKNCLRVRRGGYWGNDPKYHRTGARTTGMRDERRNSFGLRVARTLPPPAR